MTIHVVGGVYREYCAHPRWLEIFGSAGRAACAIATWDTPVVLHAYMNHDAQQAMIDRAAWFKSFQLRPTPIGEMVAFDYLYDMAVPRISGVPAQQHLPLSVSEEKVVRFGMLEGDAVVQAEWAVYDPQNVGSSQPFSANGSTAKHLALVLNSWEAAYLSGLSGAPASVCAPKLATDSGAEVVVIKMGPEGAFVWTVSGTTQVPAFRTSRVWKIGSGDCFVAHFANAWMHEGRTPAEAAQVASHATALYCQTQGFPTKADVQAQTYSPVELSPAYHAGAKRQVYLAGPFFDLAQVWMVDQARTNLRELGLMVFSPYHDIGLGCAAEVVGKDLAAIHQSDLVLALTDGLDSGTIYEIGYARALNKPVVVYSERHKDESLKMMEGSGCIMCTNYTTALYSTLWEAIKL